MYSVSGESCAAVLYAV